MSLVPNAFGSALGTSPPFLNYAALGSPLGIQLKPGSRVAAFVRSTGAQDHDDLFIRDNLVASINEGCKRCRSGAGDVVVVLNGHTETHSVAGMIWPQLVAGTKIVGCGRPGSSNNGRVTLSHAGASIAPTVADVEIVGLDIRSATAGLTAALALAATSAGFLMAGSYFSLRGALGANPPIAILGSANAVLVGNDIIVDSTDPIIEVTLDTSTDLKINHNFIRQIQATSGGAALSLANTAGISGEACYNRFKTAVDGTISQAFLGGAALPANLVTTFLLLENRSADGVNNNQAVIDPIVETV